MEGMVAGLQNAHSLWRYMVLICAALTVGMMWRGWFGNKSWQSLETRVSSFFITALDLEVVLGVAGWLLNQQWATGDILSTWRHPALMLIIWLFVRVGWYRLRYAQESRDKFRIGAIWFTLATFFVIIGVLQIGGVI